MSKVIVSACVLALWIGGPQVAAAQESESSPAGRVRAPRSDIAAARDGEPRPAPAARAATDEPRAVARTEVSPPPSQRGESRNGSENAVTARQDASAFASPATSSADTADEQGGQRRGAVRRPSSGGGSGPDRGGRGSDASSRAVPRESAPRSTAGRVYVSPRYSPYYGSRYYGGLGLGYFSYSPWGWAPSFYGYPYDTFGYGYGGGYYGGYGARGGRYYARGYDIGTVKIKVTPRDAEVYVDGYFAGEVDEFDGFTQALQLDSGGHRIEVRKPGYETLQFDVMVQPGRNITFRREMRQMP